MTRQKLVIQNHHAVAKCFVLAMIWIECVAIRIRIGTDCKPKALREGETPANWKWELRIQFVRSKLNIHWEWNCVKTLRTKSANWKRCDQRSAIWSTQRRSVFTTLPIFIVPPLLLGEAKCLRNPEGRGSDWGEVVTCDPPACFYWSLLYQMKMVIVHQSPKVVTRDLPCWLIIYWKCTVLQK